MKIEEEIKQKHFRSAKEKVFVNVIYTSNWLNYRQAEVFKTFDLSMQQFNVLRILRGQYPEAATVNLLIDRMLDKSSNASRIVEKLRVKGLVKRKECKKDRRRVDVVITESGLEMVEEATARLDEMMEAISPITEDEARQLNELLDKLRQTKK